MTHEEQHGTYVMHTPYYSTHHALLEVVEFGTDGRCWSVVSHHPFVCCIAGRYQHISAGGSSTVRALHIGRGARLPLAVYHWLLVDASSMIGAACVSKYSM